MKSQFLVSMMHILTLQRIVVLFHLHFRWSGGRLEHRDTPHGDLVGHRSRIDHMEKHHIYYYHQPHHQYVHINIYECCIVNIYFSFLGSHIEDLKSTY